MTGNYIHDWTVSPVSETDDDRLCEMLSNPIYTQWLDHLLILHHRSSDCMFIHALDDDESCISHALIKQALCTLIKGRDH